MEIQYVVGDATRPLGTGARLIVHGCNDQGSWGAGFTGALSRRWPQPERAYRTWARSSDALPFVLGQVAFVAVEPGLWVANLISQHGIRRVGGDPPIRYAAVRAGLARVARFAQRHQASVHLPRLGCGLAGGEWPVIAALIAEELLAQGIPVTVYALASGGPAPPVVPLRPEVLPMLAAEALATPTLAPLADAALLVPFLHPTTPPAQALVQATQLLTTFGGLLGLERATPLDLHTRGGLTLPQAEQLGAALALARRLVHAECPAPHFVRSPADLGPLLLAEMRPLEQEVFRVILLGTDGALLRMVDLYAGTHQSTALSVAEVFREPIRAGADRLILAHNHPSGSIVVSPDDVRSTQQLIRAGQLLDIPVEDHLVIGHTWVSLRQLGLCHWS